MATATEDLTENAKFLVSMKDKMACNPVMQHQFLQEFESQYLTKNQLERFAIQWYKTARGHKEAFPALVYNTRNDDVRFDLIDILSEEYGDGDRERIHSRLLTRFLIALAISQSDVEKCEMLPAVKHFGEDVLAVWRDGDPIYAFGLHFSLEFLASSLHVHFAKGLEKYPFLTDYDKEYFNYHKTAEQHHADFSENGMLLYAANRENQSLLEKGIDKGIELLTELWNEFHNYVFGVSLPLTAS